MAETLCLRSCLLSNGGQKEYLNRMVFSPLVHVVFLFDI